MGEWVLIWMIFQSELGTKIIAPPPIYFHDRSGGMVIPTTVPHAGPESSRGTAPLCIDGRKAPCRTTTTFPRTTGLCSSATRCSADR
jgi:hypothetical protein